MVHIRRIRHVCVWGCVRVAVNAECVYRACVATHVQGTYAQINVTKHSYVRQSGGGVGARVAQ